jgi:hypothetical protein
MHVNTQEKALEAETGTAPCSLSAAAFSGVRAIAVTEWPPAIRAETA